MNVLFDLMSGPISGSISDVISGKIIGMARKRSVEDFITYVTKGTKSIQNIDNAMFDFIARYYVYHLGEAILSYL